MTPSPTHLPSVLHSLTIPDCESVPPWARSPGGVRLQPCGRRPASSSCGEPVVITSVVRIHSAQIVHFPAFPGSSILSHLRALYPLIHLYSFGPDIGAYLFSVVQALVVVLQCGHALLLAGLALTGIDDVATEDLLPETVAAGRT